MLNGLRTISLVSTQILRFVLKKESQAMFLLLRKQYKKYVSTSNITRSYH